MLSNNKKFAEILLGILVVAALCGAGVVWLYSKYSKLPAQQNISFIDFITHNTPTGEFLAFTSEAELKEYIVESQLLGTGYGGSQALGSPERTVLTEDSALVKANDSDAQQFSTTNVQVQGIDEPDLVKTNGSQLFFSPTSYGMLYEKRVSEDRILPTVNTIKTQIVNAVPAAALAVASTFDANGELLLNKDTLVILGTQQLHGVTVKDPAKPAQTWNMTLEDGTYYQDARLYNDTLYVIVRTNVDYTSPCPIKPFAMDDISITIPCTEIFHPDVIIPTETTYTIMALDPVVGTVKHKLSFLGSYSDAVIYMAPNGLYIAYYEDGNPADLYYRMITTVGKDLLPTAVLEKIKTIYRYDISTPSKATEMTLAVEQYLRTLSTDEQKRIETELGNKTKAYTKEHLRDLGNTHITRIKPSDLSLQEQGTIPGRVLNQFSLDEYQNHLRIATTVGQQWGDVQANDLYILDDDLDVVGSVLDLGIGERVYSARFIQDKGYIVTYKQIDPFYVFDLSNPSAPKKTGELKIPGYSSYLHPLTDTLMLGVGREDNTVKLSLFSVADSSNPKEVAKYSLNEFWSEALDNHHAFLQDAENEQFFLPAGNGSYIFSYADNTLTLEKAIGEVGVKRAVYIGDVLYIVKDDMIAAYNQSTWEKIKEIELTQ